MISPSNLLWCLHLYQCLLLSSHISDCEGFVLAALRKIQFVSIIDEGTAKQEFGVLFAYARWVQE